MLFAVGTLLTLALMGVLAYHHARVEVWTASLAVLFAVSDVLAGPGTCLASWGLFLTVALLFNLRPLRRALISHALMRVFRKRMPPMSSTEREALEAGTVWWEAEIFSGRPDYARLLAIPKPGLSAEEQAFLSGPTEELCRKLDDWDITHVRRDLSPDAWSCIKEQGFFGMIIPKRYGGLEFSAQAHSAVVMKVASRSIAAGVTIMVPNSLGPAELLLRYGTEEQKNHYLPRLAKGLEVPCFALTSPEAGSDAASMPDRGVVCRGMWHGQQTLGVSLTWDKRYITLGPVATLLGLAFRLFDPDHLLGDKNDIGITLALIPTRHPGVVIGRRHNPLDIPFQNGPNSGRDVFIPMDFLIGGVQHVGQGWRMLMECLAAGRSISLPALATGAGKLACRATGAYARIRKQFKLPLGRFEGVEEPLARLAAHTYMMDAARSFTVGALDQGEHPAVASAIVKYQLTEHMRGVLNDAMDIQGGSGICLGPSNLMGRVYQSIPIAITVEGANILTRTLIVYGQGAVRAHPYVRHEIAALREPDTRKGLHDFDHALFGHLGFIVSNAVRAFWLGVTDARFVCVPFHGVARRRAQRLTRLSTAFALVSDAAMFSLGAALKRKEKLSGRLADVLAFLYMASSLLKRYQDDGEPADDRDLFVHAMDYCLHEAEKALVVVLKNQPSRALDWLLGGLVFPAGRHYHTPSDQLGHAAAQVLLSPSASRDRLTAGIFVPKGEQDALGRIEAALPAVIAAEAVEKKLQGWLDNHPLAHGDFAAQIDGARKDRVLDAHDVTLLMEARRLRMSVVHVDDFDKTDF